MQFEIPDLPDVLLDIALPGGRISGRVLDASTGAVLEGARVSLIPEGEDPAGGRGGGGRFSSRKSDTTGKDGDFTFHFLAEGTYRIEATAPRPEAGSGSTGYYPAEVPAVVLEKDRSLDDVNIALSAGGGVHLVVTDGANTPVRNASITATREGDEGTGGGRNRSRTDDQGEAWITGIEAGAYRLTIQAQGMGQEVIDNIHVAAGRFEELALTLDIGYNISVRLKDGNEQPITGADIVLTSAKGKRLSVPRRRGSRGNSYQLGALAPGNYRLDASWDDRSGTASFSVESAGSLDLVVQ